jgi:hypothetical protein
VGLPPANIALGTNTLMFAGGEAVKTMVPMVDDTVADGPKAFFFYLSGAIDDVVMGEDYAVATMTDPVVGG